MLMMVPLQKAFIIRGEQSRVVPRGFLADYLVRVQKIFIFHFGKIREDESED